MFDLLLWFGPPLIFCLVLAVALWRANDRDRDADSDAPADSASLPARRRVAPRSMQAGDWLHVVLYGVMGLFLGIALEGIVRLLTTGYWLVALLIPLLFCGVLLLDSLLDRVVDRLFPGGVRRVLKSTERRRTPWPRRLSLPAGLVVGLVLGRLGLGPVLVGFLS